MTTELIFKKNNPEKAWLDDEDIKNYFNSITQKYNLNQEDILLFKNAFILGNLVEWFNKGTSIGRSANGIIKRIKNNRFVFIPACKEQSHWTLFVYDKDNQTFHHYNSYKDIDNLRYFRPFLKSDKLGVEKSYFEEHKTPEQRNPDGTYNGDDCGVFVIAITEFLVRRYQNNSSVMNWEINDKEAEEIKKNVSWFRKMLKEDKDYFSDLATETTQKKDTELERIRQKIANASSIFGKDEANKEELEQAIKDLKTMADATTGSPEKTAWEENKEANEKLLVNLTEKLNKKNTANSPNSNNAIPQTESGKGGGEKPTDNTTKPDSNNDDIHLENETNDNSNQASEEIRKNLRQDINQAKNGTDEDKFNAIKNSGKVLGEEGFEKEKSEVAAMEKDLAINNPTKHLEAVLAKIEENLKKNKLTIEELPPEIQENYQNIKDNKDNVDRINVIISKQGAKKRIEKLKKKINKVAKASKEKIKKWKEKLIKFINSKNKYDQEHKKEAQNLLVQLEKFSQTQKPKSNDKFPTGLVVGGGILVITGLTALFVIRSKKKARRIKTR